MRFCVSLLNGVVPKVFLHRRSKIERDIQNERKPDLVYSYCLQLVLNFDSASCSEIQIFNVLTSHILDIHISKGIWDWL